jgi:hypothetical protein
VQAPLLLLVFAQLALPQVGLVLPAAKSGQLPKALEFALELAAPLPVELDAFFGQLALLVAQCSGRSVHLADEADVDFVLVVVEESKWHEPAVRLVRASVVVADVLSAFFAADLSAVVVVESQSQEPAVRHVRAAVVAAVEAATVAEESRSSQ